MNNLDMNRMEQLFDDQAFQNNLKLISNAEEMVHFFSENGVEISEEDAEEFLKGRREALVRDELDMDMLDAVTGGKVFSCFLRGMADASTGKKPSSRCFFYKLGYLFG